MDEVQIEPTGKFSVFQLVDPVQKITCLLEKSDLIGDRNPKDIENSTIRASSLYDEVFREVVTLEQASNASMSDRLAIGVSGSKPHNLTYGEITSIDSFARILGLIRDNGYAKFFFDKYPNVERKFYDLGSGSGRCVIAAAILSECGACDMMDSAEGIEILPSLYGLSRYADIQYAYVAQREGFASTRVNFYKDDILRIEGDEAIDWTDGAIVFANSTCFQKDLFYSMAKHAQRMRLGSVFVTNSKQLPSSSGFDLVEEIRLPFSWGHGDIHIHVKMR
jgi:hypothetical protein